MEWITAEDMAEIAGVVESLPAEPTDVLAVVVEEVERRVRERAGMTGPVAWAIGNIGWPLFFDNEADAIAEAEEQGGAATVVPLYRMTEVNL